MTYPSDIPEDIPWDSGDQQLSLENCRSHYNKLQHDLSSLYFHPERKKSLDIVLQSLKKFIKINEGLGPTIDGFINLMHKRTIEVMGLYRWYVVKERVTKEQKKSIFNFKEGIKRKKLKV